MGLSSINITQFVFKMDILLARANEILITIYKVVPFITTPREEQCINLQTLTPIPCKNVSLSLLFCFPHPRSCRHGLVLPVHLAFRLAIHLFLPFLFLLYYGPGHPAAVHTTVTVQLPLHAFDGVPTCVLRGPTTLLGGDAGRSLDVAPDELAHEEHSERREIEQVQPHSKGLSAGHDA